MSVSRFCQIVEFKPGKWYILIATEEHGEEAEEAYGPYATSDMAVEDQNYLSNPGGFWETPYSDDLKLSEKDLNLIANAQKTTRGNINPRGWVRW